MKTKNFARETTIKALIIGALSLLLLIPAMLMKDLVKERQNRSFETVAKINDKWGGVQTLSGFMICIPAVEMIRDLDTKKVTKKEHILRFAPNNVSINTTLMPEEKYYGIYKTIVYNSSTAVSGAFTTLDATSYENMELRLNDAYVMLGLSDLKGVCDNVEVEMGGRRFMLEAAGYEDNYLGQALVSPINLIEVFSGGEASFSYVLNLKGSQSINYIPFAKTTKVNVAGQWADPGFVGNFSPTYEIDNTSGTFAAEWSILGFNRNIPDRWIGQDYSSRTYQGTSFGVDLVTKADHYQQSMRSVKYAYMFIVLTLGILFLMELLSRKRIHPMQYLLVGLALVLFYSLLLSISERIPFGWAYLVSSVAIVLMITLYTRSMVRNTRQTLIVGGLVALLYVYLYGVLQLEDMAFLVGSIGLFVILAAVMYLSRKVNWYKQLPEDNGEECGEE